jgi:U3 small nucleolar RNA-associated protein 10
MAWPVCAAPVRTVYGQKHVLFPCLQVLMLTRSSATMTRLAAIEVAYNLVAHLREEYLPMLPETLPFLAELREDSEAAVVARAVDMIQLLETLSEEDLEEYLRT